MNIKKIPGNKETQIHALPSSLENLQIKTSLLTGLTLPPTLRKLCIVTHLEWIKLVSEEMPTLEYLLLELPYVEVFNTKQIIAPNLKTLHLQNCYEVMHFRGLIKFPRLKHLTIDSCLFPFDLFDENFLPELESFEYIGNGFRDSEYIDEPLLIPPQI